MASSFYDEGIESSPSSLLRLSLQVVAKTMFEYHWFPSIDSPLPSEISDSLMATLRFNNWLNGKTMALFDKRFRLTEVHLSYSLLMVMPIEMLRMHPIKRLTIRDTSVTDSVRDLHGILQLLGPHALTSLEYIDMSGVTPVTCIACLADLKYLTTLIVSETPAFGDAELKLVCKEMRYMRVLDLSQTIITAIAPLSNLKDTLEVLVMHRLRFSRAITINGAADTLRLLTKLKFLDISDKKVDVLPNSIGEPLEVDIGTLVVRDIVASGIPWWPSLRFLDVAGNALNFHSLVTAIDYITKFISLHPHLVYVSILDTSLNRHPYHYPYERDKPLQIANAGTRAQCLLSLQRYWRPDREAFASHALQAVYYLLQTSYDEFQPADLRLTVRGVVLSMLNHKKNIAIQMAGSACLYHLCKSKRINQLTAQETRCCVDRCLDAAENHPRMVQLQKNVWLTVCSDHLLQSLNFDIFRTCEIALESMVNTRDPSVSRMTIAVVSILAPKLPTEQSHLLATNKRYVAHLIEMINENLDNPDNGHDNFNNFTVKFTLSALWNLTDESPVTCRLFVQLGGIAAAFGILEQYQNNTNIQTKVLGLLNNIAEVRGLKKRIVHHRYIRTVLELLESDLIPDSYAAAVGNARHIDVSYFAAGILANLLDCGPWTFEPTSDHCNQSLIMAVKRWPKALLTMVAYRSFVPFFVLLKQDGITGAQMWAAWAIQHVCISDRQNNYIKLLLSQGGREEFLRLVNSRFAHPDAVQLAHSVLTLIKHFTYDPSKLKN
ncbi:Leucine Rich Repeat family protein [Brugia malayi]|uniref:Leucine Rich Repeat family protein n=1 Tax=Brugia malayi TaxID=6279 RepID=A0A4E9FHZ8_BRUMA|nr:Leucine Rich Repeat family protein [Brugia malayi]VIO95098.1 Leucine Rich Repeat family protein [Brugia malayi]